MGDGCNQEGISSEACSLAGHLKLGKLIALYDDNHITIDGRTDVSFTEDVLRDMKHMDGMYKKFLRGIQTLMAYLKQSKRQNQ